MKIYYKTDEEIELIRKSNLLVSEVLGKLEEWIKPGVTTKALDTWAEEYIRDNGGIPGFLGYQGFTNTLCTSVNDEVVHGIPSEYELKEGDVISVDCGVVLNEFYGDSAYTYKVGEVDSAVQKLLEATKNGLYKGVEKAVVGNRTGDIGHAIQTYVEEAGFSVVREMVGHGLGKAMHEPPEVPNYGRKGRGVKLQKGLVICIEPMINLGARNIKGSKDGWTIKTSDGKPSAHYELAVAIDHKQADTLTTFEYIEKPVKN